MKCPKCGHENKEGSKFCSKCGMKLSNITPSNSKKWNKWIIILTILIIILVIAIGITLGMQSHQKHIVKEAESSTVNTQKRENKQSTMSKASSSLSSSIDTSSNLKVSDLNTPQLMTAAVALYGGQNIKTGMWLSFKNPSSIGTDVNISPAQDQNVSQEGNGNFYGLSLNTHGNTVGYGGECGYILSNDGKEVYLYSIGVSPDEKIEPQLTVPVDNIVSWINQNHMADTVRDLANRLNINN